MVVGLHSGDASCQVLGQDETSVTSVTEIKYSPDPTEQIVCAKVDKSRPNPPRVLACNVVARLSTTTLTRADRFIQLPRMVCLLEKDVGERGIKDEQGAHTHRWTGRGESR